MQARSRVQPQVVGSRYQEAQATKLDHGSDARRLAVVYSRKSWADATKKHKQQSWIMEAMHERWS